MQIGPKVRLSIEFVLELGLGFVVAAACRPLVLTMSLISYVLNGDFISVRSCVMTNTNTRVTVT